MEFVFIGGNAEDSTPTKTPSAQVLWDAVASVAYTTQTVQVPSALIPISFGECRDIVGIEWPWVSFAANWLATLSASLATRLHR
jgi:hypothetical protein